jgi:predicted naringenin-chalcone synthase
MDRKGCAEASTDTIAILGIGTAVPPYRIIQRDVAERMAAALHEFPDSMRWARRIFKQCGVDTRYTCEPELLQPGDACRYMPGRSGVQAPGTAERMRMYKRESVPLAVEAARRALSDAEAEAADITHLITVSCTGQFLPGLDAVVAGQLGLSPEADRIPLQFVGCAAGLKAVGTASRLVSADRGAKVLVVCVELCTLHIQPSSEREALFGASFFGDGASACVVGTADRQRSGVFALGRDRSVLLPEGADAMVWEVGDYGFELYLSPDIPKLLGKHIPAEIHRLLEYGNRDHGDQVRGNLERGQPQQPGIKPGHALPQLWAIHPGGRGIIDQLQALFGLTEEQTRFSRSVLRDYGNMSSATILFVLAEMRQALRQSGSDAADGVAVAFGPGLTAEMLRIRYVPEPAAGQARRALDGAYA